MSDNSTPAPKTRRRWWVIIWVVLILLSLATAAGLYDLKRDLKELEHKTRDKLVTLSTELNNLQSLKQAQMTASEQRDKLQGDLNTLDARLQKNEASFSRLSGMIEGGKRQWILAEVEQLVLIANNHLLLQHDGKAALKALLIADARLSQISDNRTLVKLRQSLAGDISSLRGIPDVDLQGLVLRVNAIVKRIPKLPLSTDLPRNYTRVISQDAQPDSETNWQRFIDKAIRALKGLVNVHRATQQLTPILPPDQEFFLYQNLLLKLETARLAIMQRNDPVFHGSVELASGWIKSFFKQDDPNVKSVLADLADLKHQQLNWPLPQLDNTLSLLRHLDTGKNQPAATPAEATP